MHEHGDTIAMVSKMPIAQFPVSKTGFSALNSCFNSCFPCTIPLQMHSIHADAVSGHYFPTIQLNNEYEVLVTSHPTFPLQNRHNNRQSKRIYTKLPEQSNIHVDMSMVAKVTMIITALQTSKLMQRSASKSNCLRKSHKFKQAIVSKLPISIVQCFNVAKVSKSSES